MGEHTKIEWTGATCPCYCAFHGSNIRRITKDRREESRRERHRIPGAASCGNEMVHRLSRLAHHSRVWRGRDALGRNRGRVRRSAPRQGERSLRFKAAPSPREIIRSCARRRCRSSAASNQFPRGNRPHPASKFAPLYGLLSRMVGRRAPA